MTDPSTPHSLRDFFASREVPCPGCGYNLQGLTADRCTECGLHIELGVQPQRERWTTIAFVAIGCGWPLVTAAMNIYQSFRSALYTANMFSGSNFRYSVPAGAAFPAPSVAREFFTSGVSVYLYMTLLVLGVVGIGCMLFSRREGTHWPGRALCRYALITFGCHIAWALWNFLRNNLL